MNNRRIKNNIKDLLSKLKKKNDRGFAEWAQRETKQLKDCRKVLQKITKFEMYLIDKIVQRAASIAQEAGERLDYLSLSIDICCAHISCPLKESGKVWYLNRPNTSIMK